MKRCFDIIASVIILVLISPIMLLVGLGILLGDGKPLLFRQTRIGLRGRKFKLLKFRSMIVNAEAVGGYSTSDNDPRVTAIGRFIRRTSLDELPQLFNVLKGEMSLVGPRPDVEKQIEQYKPHDWALRTSVRPGITGLAQARLRSSATPEKRLALDLEYASQRSVFRDLLIILETVARLVTAKSN